METVNCVGSGCEARLGPSDLVCPECREPRPQVSRLALPRVAESGTGLPGSAPCDHRDAGAGSITCPSCGSPLGRRTAERFVLGTPWGECPLTTPVVDIGREVGPFASRLAGYLTVSRRHAILRVEASGRLFVVDHNSSNGTFKNATRIDPNAAVELIVGDQVSFSKSLTFDVRGAR